MDKLIRDGKVAVVYSPGFGAGWSTWNHEHAELLCMDADIALAVLDGRLEDAKRIAEEKCGEDAYISGGELSIKWVPQGEQFEVNEYDGSETVRIIGQCTFMIA